VFTIFFVMTSIPIFTGFLGEMFRPLVETPFDYLDRNLFSKIPALRSDDDDPLHRRPPSSFTRAGWRSCCSSCTWGRASASRCCAA
jgi:hypothetical protein